MNAAVMISESQKRLQIIFMFTLWLKACEANNINTSTAILSLVEYMVKELNWNRKKASQQVLDFFKNHQGYDVNQLIELYEILR